MQFKVGTKGLEIVCTHTNNAHQYYLVECYFNPVLFDYFILNE